MQAGKITDAEDYFNQVQQLESSVSPEVLCSAQKNLGCLLWHKGDREGAEQMLVRALLTIDATSVLDYEHPSVNTISVMLEALRSDLAPPPLPIAPQQKSEISHFGVV